MNQQQMTLSGSHSNYPYTKDRQYQENMFASKYNIWVTREAGSYIVSITLFSLKTRSTVVCGYNIHQYEGSFDATFLKYFLKILKCFKKYLRTVPNVLTWNIFREPWTNASMYYMYATISTLLLWKELINTLQDCKHIWIYNFPRTISTMSIASVQRCVCVQKR